ncbi:MAG: hypothetical protein COU07_00840 [Candidatus Harrisonbacteria bacterium CG10_big_fil_rev_8_21_14_0_10_40_38]|uniref:Uncharacterized protein n=1 Tax=Candidatus Harrisonbacteria bacterium CG10_big_fil_rev_8_21_14_0_10_40_38 TaxID=1974583 RepID=A0A2H0USP7_9BACT|nr:MAG: hypothetical protein COU07_00840 [Candidatus Harrisonbacteria bacterium CG10_big_fil_rev_8_21_14_0_10_40_38]
MLDAPPLKPMSAREIRAIKPIPFKNTSTSFSFVKGQTHIFYSIFDSILSICYISIVGSWIVAVICLSASCGFGQVIEESPDTLPRRRDKKVAVRCFKRLGLRLL